MFPNCNQNCPRSSDFAIPSGTRYLTPRVSARGWHSLPAAVAYCDACGARPRNDHSVCNVVEAGLAYDTFSWFRQHNSILWIVTRNTRRMELIKLIQLIPSPAWNNKLRLGKLTLTVKQSFCLQWFITLRVPRIHQQKVQMYILWIHDGFLH